jgi:hypothetical protein
VIILDHNIPENQARGLRRHRVHFRQLGFDVGRPEWDDQQEILRYLHASKQLNFITRDLGFYRYRLCHKSDCLVASTVPLLETADYVQKLLRHREFRTRALRSGKVIVVSTVRIAYWQLGRPRQSVSHW